MEPLWKTGLVSTAERATNGSVAYAIGCRRSAAGEVLSGELASNLGSHQRSNVALACMLSVREKSGRMRKIGACVITPDNESASQGLCGSGFADTSRHRRIPAKVPRKNSKIRGENNATSHQDGAGTGQF